MIAKDIIEKMNKYGAEQVPFLFLFNFELDECHAFALDELPDYLHVDFKNDSQTQSSTSFSLEKKPISKPIFMNGFNLAMQQIDYGNSFLLNLTYPSEITTNYSLDEIFTFSKAKYKVFWKDRFTCFSPETFIKIYDGKIHSFPMKGTIDAAVPNARQVILENEKEEAEHYTIVDLIRNDLSQVSKDIEVEKFRYIDEIKTHEKTLLQVSSHITGQLPDDWKSNIGNIISKLLPAGSISGAPKKKTLEIIRLAEIDTRGFYTGIAGVFDGHTVDSCVMIRFIEKIHDKLKFRSGGGITYRSKGEEEYQELIDKIYVPIF